VATKIFEFDNISEDFTNVFGVSAGQSGLVKGMWLLDHKHFKEARTHLVSDIITIIHKQQLVQTVA
jgi:hypothetical protein